MGAFKLKALEWQQIRDASHQDGEWWTASTVFGSLDVEKSESGRYLWRYCFDEYYDEGSDGCDSVEEGKGAAERLYLSRIMPALESIPPPAA